LGEAVGAGLSKAGPVNGNFLLVIRTNLQFLTQRQHIITKFSSQRLNYIHQKINLGEGAVEGRPLLGNPLTSPTLRTLAAGTVLRVGEASYL